MNSYTFALSLCIFYLLLTTTLFFIRFKSTANEWFTKELNENKSSIEKRRFVLFLVVFTTQCLLINETYTNFNWATFIITSIFSLPVILLFYKLDTDTFAKLYKQTTKDNKEINDKENQRSILINQFKKNIETNLTKEVCNLLYDSDLLIEPYNSHIEVQERAINGEQIFKRPKKGNADTFRALFDVIFKDDETKIPNEFYAPLFGYKSAKTIQIIPNQYNIDDKFKSLIQKISKLKR